MLLIRHAQRAKNAVRTSSPGGELFIAAVVVLTILVSVADAVDPGLFGEAGLEFGLFDLGGESAVLAMRQWHLLELLLAGGLLAAAMAVLRLGGVLALKVLRSAPRRAVDKVPI